MVLVAIALAGTTSLAAQRREGSGCGTAWVWRPDGRASRATSGRSQEDRTLRCHWSRRIARAVRCASARSSPHGGQREGRSHSDADVVWGRRLLVSQPGAAVLPARRAALVMHRATDGTDVVTFIWHRPGNGVGLRISGGPLAARPVCALLRRCIWRRREVQRRHSRGQRRPVSLSGGSEP